MLVPSTKLCLCWASGWGHIWVSEPTKTDKASLMWFNLSYKLPGLFLPTTTISHRQAHIRELIQFGFVSLRVLWEYALYVCLCRPNYSWGHWNTFWVQANHHNVWFSRCQRIHGATRLSSTYRSSVSLPGALLQVALICMLVGLAFVTLLTLSITLSCHRPRFSQPARNFTQFV